jgi:hypothetical protein
MSILKIYKCLFGYHQWGDWRYVSPSSCRKIRVCQICRSADDERAAHDWENWDADDRVCSRCGYVEKYDTAAEEARMKWSHWT